MSQVSTDLSPALRDWVEARVAGSDFTDVADYLRDLIRRDRAADDRRSGRTTGDGGLAAAVLEDDAITVIDSIINEDPDTRAQN